MYLVVEHSVLSMCFRLMYMTPEFVHGKCQQMQIFLFFPVNFILVQLIVEYQAQGCPALGIKDKALSFAHYLASALADPRFVGVHWFQWIDQSAAGRKIVKTINVVSLMSQEKLMLNLSMLCPKQPKKMYPARNKTKQSTESILFELLKN